MSDLDEQANDLANAAEGTEGIDSRLIFETFVSGPVAPIDALASVFDCRRW